jgi:glycosyltransferase involved in cell wall biosynthesis
VTRLSGVAPAICPEHSLTLPSLRILEVLMHYKPDVVHCFDLNIFSVAMVSICWFADIPVTASHHTRADLYQKTLNCVPIPDVLVDLLFNLMIYRPLFSSADGHLAVCEPIRKMLQGGGCRHVQIWNSGVDLESFHPGLGSAALRKSLSRGRPELPLIAHVGRLAPEKNADQIGLIVSAYHRKYPGTARFAIIGDGPSRARVEEDCQLVGAGAHFTGFLRGDELYRSFASIDIFFSPSTTEAFPLVYLEALASGAAVSGPDSGGVPETFVDGVHGHLFRPLDAESAAEALHRTVVQFTDKRAQRQKLARARAEEHSWVRVVDELVEMMRSAVSRHGGQEIYSTKRGGKLPDPLDRDAVLQWLIVGLPVTAAAVNGVGMCSLASLWQYVA